MNTLSYMPSAIAFATVKKGENQERSDKNYKYLTQVSKWFRNICEYNITT